MGRMKIAFSLALGIALGGPLGFAGIALADYDAGMTAYNRADYPTAVREFRAAADKGDARSQLMLGRLYAQGNGVPQDFVQAHMWYNLAAAKGNAEAATARDDLAQRMTPAQLAQAQDMASRGRQAGKTAAPAAAPATAAATSRSEQIRMVQQALNRQGYNAGTEDGKLGKGTRAAIRAFQKDQGMKVTGDLSPALVSRLEASAANQPTSLMPPEQALADGGRLQTYVENVQNELRTHGYYTGPATGQINERTRNAIREYQLDAGLQVNGIVSEDLLNNLKFVSPPVYRNQKAGGR